MTEYGIKGMVLGIILGALLGILFLNQVKMSQRKTVLPFGIAIGVIIGGLVGYSIGASLGKDSYIENRLGITKPIQHGYSKEGRYWFGVTDWIDPRDNKNYRLLTARSNHKGIISVLNNRPILIHDTTSASKESIPRCHQLALKYVRERLKNNFTESEADWQSLFPSVN